MTDFDRYAANYEATLSQALAVSGENTEYFARGRIAYLKACLDRLSVPVKSVLDFGCGIGSGTRLLAEILGAVDVLGVDVSARSIAHAQQANPHARFMTLADYVPACEFDLAFCNGVFHHIPPTEGSAPSESCCALFDRAASSRSGRTIPGIRGPGT
jgi:SAM-dependent methyltransferase